jgi:hypothetical protein
MPPTVPGQINQHGQMLVRKTDRPGNHRNQRTWILRCVGRDPDIIGCGYEYGANGCDYWERRCPNHQDGAAGLPVDN